MQTPIQTTLDETTAGYIASLFEALSDPTRVRIVSILVNGETNVGELAAQLGMSASAISHQVRILRDKRLLRTRKQGRYVFVALDDEHIAELYQRGLEHALHR